jgi:hypothetical protein
MEKRRYYVSVKARTMVPNQGDAPYELEIDATEDEAERLGRIFDQIDKYDEASGVQAAFIPPITHMSLEDNEGYDYFLKQAYQLIYDLGSDETKEHIRSMRILRK